MTPDDFPGHLPDRRDLFALERAIDALEALHDYVCTEDEPKVRACLCNEASAWRGARKVTVAWRRALGLKVRLLDTL